MARLRLAYRIREGKELRNVIANPEPSFQDLPPIGTKIQGYRQAGDGEFEITEFLPASSRNLEWWDYEVIVKPLEKPYPILPGFKFRYFHQTLFTHRCTICGDYFGRHSGDIARKHYEIAKREGIPVYVTSHREMTRLKAALGFQSWTPFRNRFRTRQYPVR